MSVKHMDCYLEELEWRFKPQQPLHLPRRDAKDDDTTRSEYRRLIA